MAFWNRDKEVSERSKQFRMIRNRILTVVILFMAAATALYAGYTLIANSSIFVPQGADGVLKAIEPDPAYGWGSESVRLLDLGGSKTQQDAVRGVIVNTELNKFRVQQQGVLPERTYYYSDGKFTAQLDENRIDADFPWVRVTDICNDAPTIPADEVTLPTPQDFLDASPQLQTDEGTFLGDRAWVIDFTPSPAIVSRLLMLDFFTTVTDGEPESAWVISDKERKLIAEGEFTSPRASIWVNYNGNREIRQIDMIIELDGGSSYRILAQRSAGIDDSISQDDNYVPLAALDNGDPQCGLSG